MIEFKPIPINRGSRCVTKHFANLGLWLPKINLAMMMWLLYWADKGGSFKYSTEMLDKFVLSAKFASEEYSHPPLRADRKTARAVFRELEGMGLVVKVAGKNYQINKELIR